MDSDMEHLDSSSEENDSYDGNITKEASGEVSVDEATNQDFQTILTKYKTVRVLYIHSFICCGIKYLRKLYKLPNLESLSLSNGFNGFWGESFANIKNYTLTHLSIDDIIMYYDIIACTKAFPNMISFDCGKVVDHSFNMFRAMSKNWPKLKSLSLKLKEDEYEGGYNGKDVIFPNLRDIHFQLVECNSMAEVFAHLKAPKLETFGVVFFQGNYKNFAPMNQNCPNLKEVTVFGRNNATLVRVKKMFPNAQCNV